MTVVLLQPHGFCSGVRNALDRAERALASGNAVYCLHELVHNEQVVDDLKARGMRFVASVEAVPEGATLLLSAHGVAPAVRAAAAARRLNVVDATCPFVACVHRQVVDFARRGLPIVVVGHAGHAEVVGVAGEARAAGARVAVVGTGTEAAALDFPEQDPVGVVSQTTFAAEVVEAILAYLRGRYPRLETTRAAEVCTATRDRQDAVRAFVRAGGDGVLVIGSAHSSNTCRLVEIAQEAGARAWRVLSADDLAACSFEGVRRLGVTAGASTPEPIFSDITAQLSRLGDSPLLDSWIDRSAY